MRSDGYVLARIRASMAMIRSPANVARARARAEKTEKYSSSYSSVGRSGSTGKSGRGNVGSLGRLPVMIENGLRPVILDGVKRIMAKAEPM